MGEKKFVEGLWYEIPTDKTPDFIKARLSFDKAKFIKWLTEAIPNNAGYVKVDVKLSKEGKPYLEQNTWTPEKREETPQRELSQEEKDEGINVDDIPF